MAELEKLAARVEREGPSRELDAEIARAFGWRSFYLAGFGPRWQKGHGTVTSELPAYTASIDAALTLVPEGWDWFKLRTTTVQTWVEVGRKDGTGMIAFSVEASTPAAALCAAALRANQESQND